MAEDKSSGNQEIGGIKPGTVLENRFEILKELGQGGMAVVYQAKDRQMDRIVAVKFLSTSELTEKSQARFKREAKALSTLTHPNIVQVYAYGLLEGYRPFMIMEYLDAEELGSVIQRDGPLPSEEALAITRQVCEGLICAHDMGIVHRDLKPGNIVLTQGGKQAKIVDFGIARLGEDTGAQKLTQTGQIFGSPAYMSPEQCQGESVDQRSDIYSLGCVLYEMLCGEAPFKADTLMGTLMAHLHTATDQLVANKRIPADIKEILLRSLHREREKRFPDCRELLNQLDNVDLTKTSWSPHYSVRAWSVRKRLVVFTLVVLAMIGALAFWTQGKTGKPTPQAEVRQQLLPYVDGSDEVAERLRNLHTIERNCIDRLHQYENEKEKARTYMDLGSSYFNASKSYPDINLISAARFCFNRAIPNPRKCPNNQKFVECLRSMAECANLQKDWTNSLEIYGAYSSLHGEDYFSTSGMGVAHFNLGQLKESQAYYEKALQMARDSLHQSNEVDALLDLLLVAVTAKDHQKTEYWARKILEKNTSKPGYNLQSHIMLASSYDYQGKKAESAKELKIAEEMIAVPSANAALCVLKGELGLRAHNLIEGMNNYSRAVEIYKTAPAVNPMDRLERLSSLVRTCQNWRKALLSAGFDAQAKDVQEKVIHYQREYSRELTRQRQVPDMSFLPST